MKVLMINGSPHENGCTKRALDEVARELNAAGIGTRIMTVGGGQKVKHGCIACSSCSKLHKCVFDDSVNEAIEEMNTSDGIVIGSPVYFASANGTLVSFLDRLFYAGKAALSQKVGAVVVSARRGGNTATFDELNKYLFITNMFVPGSTYWNQVHGNTPQEVEQDIEGLQTMRMLGKNMAFLLKAIEKSGLEKPEIEAKVKTNFTR